MEPGGDWGHQGCKTNYSKRGVHAAYAYTRNNIFVIGANQEQYTVHSRDGNKLQASALDKMPLANSYMNIPGTIYNLREGAANPEPTLKNSMVKRYSLVALSIRCLNTERMIAS